MRITEKLVNSPEEEGVTLEYIRLTKDFEEIKEYVQHKGDTLIGYKQAKEKASVRVEDILYFETVDGLPFGLALICMIPCIPIYLKEDMTISQIMWQRGIELVVLEIAMCAVIYLIMGDSVSIVVYVAILISTAVCDVVSYLVKWYLEKEEADKINRRIAEHRRKKENR